MRKLFAIFLCLTLLLAGCSTDTAPTGTIPPVAPEIEPEETETPTTDTDYEAIDVPAAEPEDTALLSVSVPAITEQYILENGTTLFSYTAQHMELILPDEEVADRVILDFLNRVDKAQADSESVLLSAKNDYQADANWIPYFYQIIYIIKIVL